MTPTYLQASSCHCLRASPLCHRLYVGNLAHKNRTMMLAFGPCFKQGRHRRDGKYQQLRDDNAPLAECVTEHKPSQHSSRSQTSLSNRHLNMLYSASSCTKTSSQPMQLRLENILRERNYKTISELFVATYTTRCNQGLQSHVRLVMCSCKVTCFGHDESKQNPTACVVPAFVP